MDFQYKFKSRRGGALPLVLSIIVIGVVGLSLIIRQSVKEDSDVRKQEVIENVRDGMKFARQYASNYIISTVEDNVMNDTQGNGLQLSGLELRNNIESYLNARFSAREGWSIELDSLGEMVLGTTEDGGDRALDDKYYDSEGGDAFNWSLGYLQKIVKGGNKVRIGLVDNNENLKWGARVSIAGTEVDSRIIYPTNFAWMDFGNITDPDLVNTSDNSIRSMNLSSSDLKIELPKYIRTSNESLDGSVVANRTGGVFTVSPLSVSDIESLSYNGPKPFYVHSGVNNIREVSDSGVLNNKRTSGVIQAGREKSSSVNIDNSNNINSYLSKIRTAEDVQGTLNLMPFSKTAGNNEASPANFWNNNPVKQNADIVVDLVYDGPESVSINNEGGNSGLVRETNRAVLDELNRGVIKEYYDMQYLEFFSTFGNNYQDDCNSYMRDFMGKGEDYVCATFEDYWDHIIFRADNLTEGEGNIYDRSRWEVIKEAYNYGNEKGIVRIQKFPGEAGTGSSGSNGLSGYYLVYDPVLIVGNKYGYGPDEVKDFSFSTSNGIYVNVNDANLNHEQKSQIYRRALMLPGRKYYGSDTVKIGDSLDEESARYGVYLNPEIKYFIGTNGKLTIDTRLNVNNGVTIDDAGRITSHLEPAENGLENPTKEGLNYKSIFVSNHRPAITYLRAQIGGNSITQAELDAAARDTNLTATQLILGGPGWKGVYHNSGVTTAELLSDKIIFGQNDIFNGVNSKASENLIVNTYPNKISISDIEEGDSDVSVNNELRKWAKDELIELFSSPTRNNRDNIFYNTAIADRLRADSVPGNEIYNDNKDAMSEELLDELLEHVGRMEETAYIKIYLQTFGWNGSYNKTFTYEGDMNVRVGFSGNIKSSIYAECIDEEGNTYMDELVHRANFSATSFSQVPEVNLLSIRGEAALENYIGYPNNTRFPSFLSFTTPSGSSSYSEGSGGTSIPKNVGDLRTLFYGSKGSEGNKAEDPRTLIGSNNNGVEEIDFETLNDFKSEPVFSSNSNQNHENILNNKLENSIGSLLSILENHGLEASNGSNLGFFGRVEYTLAVSEDTGLFTDIDNTNYKFYASWTLDTGDSDIIGENNNIFPLRIVSINVEDYRDDSLSSAIKYIPITEGELVGTANGLEILKELRVGLLGNLLDNTNNNNKLQVAVNNLVFGPTLNGSKEDIADYLDSINAFLAKRTSSNSSIRVEKLGSAENRLAGGIIGERRFEYNITTPSITPSREINNSNITWDLFRENAPLGHGDLNAEDYNMNNITDQKWNALRNMKIANSIIVETGGTIQDPTREYSNGAPDEELVNVINNAYITDKREYSLSLYNAKWGSSLKSPLGSDSVVSTESGNGLDRIDDDIKKYIYDRPVKFKLFVKTNGSYRPDAKADANSFTGVGVLMTSASTPQPNLLLGSATDNINFTWHGTVITGIGYDSSGTDGYEHGSKMNTILIGDPLLVGPKATTRAETMASGTVKEHKRGLWGSLSVIEDVIANDDDTDTVTVLEVQ